VVHLAARKQVGESVAQPTRHYPENVGGPTMLLDAVAGAGITSPTSPRRTSRRPGGRPWAPRAT
jgi:dTDP-D-glucose 4,6-dehydratase